MILIFKYYNIRDEVYYEEKTLMNKYIKTQSLIMTLQM